MTETEISQSRKSLNRFKLKENDEVMREREREGEREQLLLGFPTHTHAIYLSLSDSL